MLRIVRGEPSDEDVAALIAVFVGLADSAAEPPAPRSAWADPTHRLRIPLHPRPDAWRNVAPSS
jgi:acyl-CoA carboxylase epsilon subunit